ncbi:pilus assembly protein TadG-related protein [Chlorobaculum thiosulfatiphilum]|nr:pilus assembly protein TadG-related protein [Chlorobaculum thiosulfatiphilum]
MTMTRLRSIDRRLHHQRGGVAIWFALLLLVLLGFAALAVDLARLHLVKVELQSAADAAAMGGACSLIDAGGDPFNWAAAEAKALELAQQNVVNGAQIQQATIETGYWNLQSRSWSSTFVTGYLPAVRATIAISGTQNNGPLSLLFAPVLVNGVAPTINLGSIYAFDGEKVLSGQWTTFQSYVKNPDVPFMRDLIDNGNATELSIGNNTYIQPGAKATLYSEVPVGTTVGMFIVDEVDTNAFVPIVAIAAFHIDGYSQGGKYITGHFVDAAIIPGLYPGDGSGGLYGAYTPPILVR